MLATCGSTLVTTVGALRSRDVGVYISAANAPSLRKRAGPSSTNRTKSRENGATTLGISGTTLVTAGPTSSRDGGARVSVASEASFRRWAASSSTSRTNSRENGATTLGTFGTTLVTAGPASSRDGGACVSVATVASLRRWAGPSSTIRTNSRENGATTLETSCAACSRDGGANVLATNSTSVRRWAASSSTNRTYPRAAGATRLARSGSTSVTTAGAMQLLLKAAAAVRTSRQVIRFMPKFPQVWTAAVAWLVVMVSGWNAIRLDVSR